MGFSSVFSRFQQAERDGQAQTDAFNGQLHANPAYVEFLRSIGVQGEPFGPNWGLNDRQRKLAEDWIRQNVADIGKLEVDPAGNVNQNEGLGKQLGNLTPALIAAGAALTGGAALGAFGGGAGAAAAGGGATAAGGGAGAGGVLASSAIPGLHAAVPGAIASQGVSAGLAGGLAGAGTAAAGGGIGGFLKNFLPKNLGEVAGMVGPALGAGAQAAAANRGTEMEAGIAQESLRQSAENQFWQQLLAREAEGRESRNDSMRNLQRAEYIQNWKPTTTSFSPYTRQLQGPSDTVKQGAASMEQDLLRRIAGNVLPEIEKPAPFVIPGQKPGFFEQFAGYASPVLTFLGRK